MVETHIRRATLDDTRSISHVFRAHISAWQRLNAQGQVEDVPYTELTIYERWLHGGAWMSVETGAIHLSHLLRGAGVPLVAEVEGHIAAYTELYEGVEPAPFGASLSLTHPTLHPRLVNQGLEIALLDAAREQAAQRKCERLLVSSALPEAQQFYQAQGLQSVTIMQRFSLPAKTGQGFYRTVEHLDPDPVQIKGWHMPIGRRGSARQQWETLWPRTWDSLPEIRQRRTHRLKLNAAGQDSFVCCQQQLYVERSADIACWSPRPLTSQLLTAIRDWSHREGYRTLVLIVPEDTAKILGPEAEPDGYSEIVYGTNI
ncbi:MAG: GNAT family N-acetyltransferase [Anaerolineae bacterium]|nr:GNAT family N-acetyltransferase [Anaerolineae bacterium]